MLMLTSCARACSTVRGVQPAWVFPAAMLDVVDIEDESPQELLARAEREGLDLRDFAVDDD